MNIAYINISPCSERDSQSMKARQWHSLLYKQELARTSNVHYLLRNSHSFAGHSSALKITAIKGGIPAFLFFVIRYIVRHRIRVVIIHNLGNFIYVPVLKSIPGLKVILQHHGEVTYLHKKALFMRFADWFTDAYFFHGIGNAAPFIKRKCISESKVREVPEATSDFRFQPPENVFKKRLIFIGRLDRNKNLITLLKSLILLNEYDFELNIYFTEDRLEGYLQDFCVSNGLKEKVHFNGKVPSPEIEMALQESDFFISCSKYEGSGYSLIEALACGVFPVVSKIAPFDYLLSGLEFSRQFSPEDEIELSERLREVFRLKLDLETRKRIRVFFEERASPVAVASVILKTVEDLQKD